MTTPLELSAVLASLSESDRAFAESMIGNAARYGGRFTERQAAAAARLIERVTNPRQVEEVGTLDGLKALFATASRSLKSPKLLAATAEGEILRLKPAKDTSKNPGAIYVMSRSGGTYLGKVTPAGEFVASWDAGATTSIAAALREMAERPAEAAARYGKLIGSCCFCGLELSDERSTEVGYGPTCAKNWGLPWGSYSADEVPAETAGMTPGQKAAATRRARQLAGSTGGAHKPVVYASRIDQ